jgi:hypothetical protein
MIEAFPIYWPENWPRTRHPERSPSSTLAPDAFRQSKHHTYPR